MHEPTNRPSMVLKTIKSMMLPMNIMPIVSASKMKRVENKTGRRPYLSDKGPHINCPN
jgi:hypothetical protein